MCLYKLSHHGWSVHRLESPELFGWLVFPQIHYHAAQNTCPKRIYCATNRRVLSIHHPNRSFSHSQPQYYSFDRPSASRRSTLSKSHHHLNLATGPSLSLGRSRNWCHSASTLFGVTSPLPSSIHCNSWICIFSLYKLSHHDWSVALPSQPQSYSFDRPSASRRPKIKSTNLFVVGSPSQRSHSNELLTC